MASPRAYVAAGPDAEFLWICVLMMVIKLAA